MKVLLKILSALIFCICIFPLYGSEAKAASDAEYILPAFKANEKSYALLREGAELCDESQEIITTLPATYFVEISTGNINYYTAIYNGLSGYILKSDITLVDYEPVTKFATAYFTADNDTHSVLIRTSPQSSANVAAVLADGAKAYLFGTKTGDAIIPAAGNLWYCIKYDSVIGYVYSAQGVTDDIPDNVIEKVQPVQSPDDPAAESPSLDWIYILALCIPAVIIMFTLFARPKANQD